MKFILVFFILFIPSILTASNVENFPILKGDIKSISFNNSKDLSNSVIDVIKNFTDEANLNKIKQELSKPDNLNINPVNYSEFSSLLPLPSDTIIRIINNNFSSEGLYNFFEYDFKKDIIFSYGASVNIEFEIIEITPSNLKNNLSKGALAKTVTRFPTNNPQLDTFLLAPISAVPLLFNAGLGGGSSGSSTEENLNTSVFETTEYNNQWGLGAINSSTAYARGYTGSGITVSVMDNTFDTDHPDLVGIWVTGYNALDQSTDVHCESNSSMNSNGCVHAHGTHVAGTIAALKDGTEMHGVAYDAKVKPIVMADGSWDSSSLTTAELINGIGEGTGSGIAAMNNSWGVSSWYSVSSGGSTYYYQGPKATSSAMGSSELAAWEAGAADTVIVFSNGNDGMNTETGRVAYYTAQNTSTFSHYEDNTTDINDNIAGWYGSQGYLKTNLIGKWLTVVAIDSSNEIANFSNGCGDAKNYCISAPGVSIYAPREIAQGSGNYVSWNGTSMAAPHVTGVIAILKQQFPNLTTTQMVSLLIDSATDLGASGVDEVYGVGMVNLGEATKPTGTAFVAAKNANTANGGTMGTPTPSSTSFNFSSPFGYSLATKNLSFGFLDSFNRSYIWNPKISYSSTSDLNFTNFVNSINKKDNKKIIDFDNTQISFLNSNQNTMQSFKIDHKINKLSFTYDNQNIKENIFDLNSNSKILRFNKIKSTDKNIVNMSSNYEINKNFSFTSGYALGEFNNSNKFNESYYDINYNNDFYSLNYGYGTIVEQNQFLGTEGKGAYQINKPSVNNFIDVDSNLLINKNLEFNASYTQFNTNVDMMYKNFVNISDIKSDEFKLGFTLNKLFEKEDKLSLNFISPLSTTSGKIIQHTTKGYNKNGSYKSLTEHYSLKNENRQKNINLIYQYNLNSNLNFVSAINYNANELGQAGFNNLGLYQGLSFIF